MENEWTVILEWVILGWPWWEGDVYGEIKRPEEKKGQKENPEKMSRGKNELGVLKEHWLEDGKQGWRGGERG